MSLMTPPVVITKKDTNNIFIANGSGSVITSMPDDTMTGEIEPGQVIAIDTTSFGFLEDGIFAFYWHGIFMVKRLQFISGRIRVIPASKYYMEWEIIQAKSEPLKIIGRVVASQTIRRH
ncbi:hypothetical protein ABMA09_18810 [Erwinia rhapontici]|uniref:S24 family peptidase n=1 Tax=Erwinia rhapontici TaxID=55212 RepID=UPI003D36E977